jgi:hypothetical protein
MKKGLRLSDQWFQRGLWLIALLFAGFLIGLGGKIVGDLPKTEKSYSIDTFTDAKAAEAIKAERKILSAKQDVFQKELDALEESNRRSSEEVSTAEQNFSAWISTRSASQASEQNPELVKRTQRLEALRDNAQKAKQAIRDKNLAGEPLRQEFNRVDSKANELQQTANDALQAATKAQDIRVFLYRLALTLPLLGIAAWLFIKQRKSQYWPFVWGFIFFALFAFFVELVPYMPSYGGYVRYAVGAMMTVLVGSYGIKAMQRYQAKQAQVEQMPEEERREEIDYEQALQRMTKNICPGCERPINTAAESENFCGHCGMGIFRPCGGCGTRNNAFTRYCKVCGVTNTATTATLPPVAAPLAS